MGVPPHGWKNYVKKLIAEVAQNKHVCFLYVSGVGIGYMVLNGLVCIYYNVIIATSLYYLFASFTANLPWGSCGHEWNTIHCGDPTSDVGNMSSESPSFLVMRVCENEQGIMVSVKKKMKKCKIGAEHTCAVIWWNF